MISRSNSSGLAWKSFHPPSLLLMQGKRLGGMALRGAVCLKETFSFLPPFGSSQKPEAVAWWRYVLKLNYYAWLKEAFPGYLQFQGENNLAILCASLWKISCIRSVPFSWGCLDPFSPRSFEQWLKWVEFPLVSQVVRLHTVEVLLLMLKSCYALIFHPPETPWIPGSEPVFCWAPLRALFLRWFLKAETVTWQPWSITLLQFPSTDIYFEGTFQHKCCFKQKQDLLLASPWGTQMCSASMLEGEPVSSMVWFGTVNALGDSSAATVFINNYSTWVTLVWQLCLC